MADDISRQLGILYRSESRRILATLIRLLGDFDLAEDALQEAFRAALEKWSAEGAPGNPIAWLISVGRFKAIDRLRRQARIDTPLESIPEPAEPEADFALAMEKSGVPDDRLRLIFICSHPALAPEARVALTLREVCNLTTEEIARAFLTSPSTVAQRIVRAKNKIRDARIPYELPAPADLPERLDTVLQVVYLVFNEGYSASSGESLTRADLSSEAIRLGRLLLELLSDSEILGLLALMLFQESRRAERSSPEGDIVLLENQDRSLWNHDMILEGSELVTRALRSRRLGPYTLQAAIAATHAQSPSAEATNWNQIVGFYDVLARIDPSPVVSLNRAVAVAMRDGPSAGLELVDQILKQGELTNYHLAFSARADFCRRLGKMEEARAAYREALKFAQQTPERRFLERRLTELG